MKFVLATNNLKKQRELQQILSHLGVELCTQRELGLKVEPEETGETYAENALIKARALWEASGLPAIADDSGLEVDALEGRPGVHTARYGGEGLTDRERYERLLRELEDRTDRGAKFVSVIACVLPDGESFTARGECPGEILRAPRGEGGFGYDPIFYLREQGAAMAEIPPEVKNRVSHRAWALEKFAQMLKERL